MATRLLQTMRFLIVVVVCLVAGSIAVHDLIAQDLGGGLFDGPEFGAAESNDSKSAAPPAKAKPLGKPMLDSAFSGGIFDGPGFGSELFGAKPGVTIKVEPESAKLGETVTISVTVVTEPGAHTYPIDDQSTSTLLLLATPPSLEEVDDKFAASKSPELKDTPGVGPTAVFKDGVTWSKRYRVISVDEATAIVQGSINYQECKTLCEPKKKQFETTLTLDASRFDSTGGYVLQPLRNGEPDPVRLQFELVPASPRAGEEVTLAVSLLPEAGWHALAIEAANGQQGPTTQITLGQIDGLQELDEAFVPNESPERIEVVGSVQNQHPGSVTWQKRFLATSDGIAQIVGEIRYHICKEDDVCLPANTVRFALGADQPGDLVASAGPVEQSRFDRGVFSEAAQSEASSRDLTLFDQFVAAFLGGLILNVMPCVLPVLAIKVMSFVQQAGESKGRILALNLAYSAGVLGVFAILGTLSVTIGLGFGDQFQSVPFTVAMCVVVMIAALSLVGVFEIPVPGFLGNSGATHQEGLTGAFLTGVMATALATPCTGPFIGPVIAWAAKQPALMNYGIWMSMGLGMTSPYLVAGVYPRIIDYLPRPGMWMVYFKQISGFILLGTVVFLMNGIPSEYRLQMLTALVGIAFACWILGTFRPHERFTARVPVFATAALIAVSVSAFAYKLTRPSDYELPWQPFSGQTLQALVDRGEPVLVDFTADWCLICKQNEFTSLNVESTYDIVKAEGVTTLYADFTHESPEIRSWLEKFGQSGVPLTVVYPRGGGEPIKLTGPYSKDTLVKTLKRATEDRKVAFADRD